VKNVDHPHVLARTTRISEISKSRFGLHPWLDENENAGGLKSEI